MMQHNPFSMDFSSSRAQLDLQQPKARNQPQGQLAAMMRGRLDVENELYLDLNERPSSAPPDPRSFQPGQATTEDPMTLLRNHHAWKPEPVSSPLLHDSSRPLWSQQQQNRVIQEPAYPTVWTPSAAEPLTMDRSASPFQINKRPTPNITSSGSRAIMEENSFQRGYFNVFGRQEEPTSNIADQPSSSYTRFPMSRPMSPPIRSQYVTSPPPRANSTPPTNHHLNA
ncbi:hypothetical protein BD560DRAFT_14436, partial [Blakeslea trispora]